MIFTHCGKMGDMFQCLPILSWWYKTKGEKPKLALANFPFAKQSEELIMMQDCVSEVIYLNYTPDNMKLGGQPYHFDLRQYYDGFDAWFNLGFRSFPNHYYGDFIAGEYQLGYDYDFVLNLGEKRNKYRGKTVVIDKFENNVLANNKIKGEYLSPKNSLLKNLQFAMGASNVKTYTTASALLLLMAGKNITVYGEPNLVRIHLELVYDKLPGRAAWVSL